MVVTKQQWQPASNGDHNRGPATRGSGDSFFLSTCTFPLCLLLGNRGQNVIRQMLYMMLLLKTRICVRGLEECSTILLDVISAVIICLHNPFAEIWNQTDNVSWFIDCNLWCNYHNIAPGGAKLHYWLWSQKWHKHAINCIVCSSLLFPYFFILCLGVFG